MESIMEAGSAGDAASLVLSRPAAAQGTAFIDGATGRSLSFLALRRGALSLASGLRLGLGLRRGDAVLVLSRNSLLLPQILVGVLAAGGVLLAADPDATAAEIAAAAHGSGAVMIVAEPEAAAKVAGVGVPLLLTSRSLDPRALSAEELIDGGDPTEFAAEPADLAYSSSTTTMTHADVVLAAAPAAVSGGGRRVCLASLPMCSAHGLPLIALGLPAAGVTTVLLHDNDALREAVAKHGATDVVAAPEAAATLLAAGASSSGSLSSLRRVIVAPTPLTPEARHEFRRRLPWVHLTELAAASSLPTNVSQPAQQMSATNNEVPILCFCPNHIIYMTHQ